LSSDEKYDENTTGLQLEVHGNEKEIHCGNQKRYIIIMILVVRVNKNFIGGDEEKSLGSVDMNKYFEHQ